MRNHLLGATAQLALPFGFTITVAGVIVASISRWPGPTLLDGWLFAVGAVFVHASTAVLLRFRPRDLSRRSSLLINAVPIVAIPAAAAGSEWIPIRALGFFVAGVLAVGLYVVGVAAAASLGAMVRERVSRVRH